MCSGCAKVLRFQTNRCPICRQPVERLLEIKVGPEPEEWRFNVSDTTSFLYSPTVIANTFLLLYQVFPIIPQNRNWNLCMTLCLTCTAGWHCTWLVLLYKPMPPPCLFGFTSNFYVAFPSESYLDVFLTFASDHIFFSFLGLSACLKILLRIRWKSTFEAKSNFVFYLLYLH